MNYYEVKPWGKTNPPPGDWRILVRGEIIEATDMCLAYSTDMPVPVWKEPGRYSVGRDCYGSWMVVRRIPTIEIDHRCRRIIT